MKQKGFAPLVIIVILAMIGVLVYFSLKYVQLSRQTEVLNQLHTSQTPISTVTPKIADVSNVVIPDIIDQWVPRITWSKPTTGNYQVGWMEKPAFGVMRKGTISDPNPNPYDLVSQINRKLVDIGWQQQLPAGASGPMESVATYSISKNGASKTLVIDVKMIDDVAKTLPTYRSEIVVFQEQ